MQKSWLCLLWIIVCWLGIVEPARADEHRDQRNFASADEAANALVTALRKPDEADWHNILGPEAISGFSKHKVQMRMAVLRTTLSWAV